MKSKTQLLKGLMIAIAGLAGGYSLEAQTISTVAGNGTLGYAGDAGQATAAEINQPNNVAFDAAGNMYISDQYNHCIRKVGSSGVISTIAGNVDSFGIRGDGGAAISASLFRPGGMVIDASNNIYFADLGNHTVRKISAAGVITRVAGTGFSGFGGDGGQATAADLYTPSGIAMDAAGNIYIADQENNRIRKVSTSGIISTIAGNGTAGFSGDSGAATAAELSAPYNLAVDGSANVYVADFGNNRIRKVTPAGIITTVVGTGTRSFSGDGGAATAATISIPQDIKFDTAWNMYIADNVNNRIRKITPAGIITTIAGNGTAGSSGDGGPATAAELSGPSGVAIDRSGNVYISDQYNNRIRKISPATTTGVVTYTQNADLKLFPNPTRGAFALDLAGNTGSAQINITDLAGKTIMSKTTDDKIVNFDLSKYPAGNYIVNVAMNGKTFTSKVVVQ